MLPPASPPFHCFSVCPAQWYGPILPCATRASGTCQSKRWQTLMLIQISNNRAHFIITRVQPGSLIWVTLGSAPAVLHCRLSFLQVLNYFESEFSSMPGEMTYEPADKSQLIGKA